MPYENPKRDQKKDRGEGARLSFHESHLTDTLSFFFQYLNTNAHVHAHYDDDDDDDASSLRVRPFLLLPD